MASAVLGVLVRSMLTLEVSISCHYESVVAFGRRQIATAINRMHENIFPTLSIVIFVTGIDVYDRDDRDYEVHGPIGTTAQTLRTS
jgi:hypothetical protein